MDDKTRIMCVFIGLALGLIIITWAVIYQIIGYVVILDANMLTMSQTIYEIHQTQHTELRNQLIWAEHIKSPH